VILAARSANIAREPELQPTSVLLFLPTHGVPRMLCFCAIDRGSFVKQPHAELPELCLPAALRRSARQAPRE